MEFMKWFFASLLLLFLCTPGDAGPAKKNRAQMYATYKAHTILPESLQYLVRRDGKHLFNGLQRGLSVSRDRITEKAIMRETQKITTMVNSQRPFKEVIGQMGFVSGLLAIYTDPSLDSNRSVQQGFRYYLNVKLERCLFVFEGYEAVNELEKAQKEAWLHSELGRISEMRGTHKNLLEDRYQKVGQNARYIFNERSAVFGVCSIYFSNLARLSAHLWYYAWSSAHGDVTKTPFQGRTAK